MLRGSLISPMLVFVLASVTFAQERENFHQPALTLQNSGTANGLIAVSPVNSRVVWVAGRGGTFVVTRNGGKTWNAGGCQEPKRCNFAMSRE